MKPLKPGIKSLLRTSIRHVNEQAGVHRPVAKILWSHYGDNGTQTCVVYFERIWKLRRYHSVDSIYWMKRVSVSSMQRGRRRQQWNVEAGPRPAINLMLRIATCVILLEVSALAASQHAVASPAATEQQKRGRSSFEYNDGSPEEKRSYRHPDLDVDPTNLKLEELRGRINGLEERLERLEHQSNVSSNGSSKVR